MTLGRLDRFLITTEPRPLRLAVILETPVTRRSYRRAIQSLTASWGGARSVLATTGTVHPLDETWLPPVRALDPDAIYIPRRFASARLRTSLASFLAQNGVSPRWIVPFTDSLHLDSGWRPQAVSTFLGDAPADSDDLASVRRGLPRRLTPQLEALLGLPIQSTTGVRGRRRDAAGSRGLASAFVRGSPIARSADVTPHFDSRPFGPRPFVLHDTDDIETGMWLWNVRALRGGFRHGGVEDFERYLAQIPAGRRIRHALVHVGPLPPRVAEIVDAAGLSESVQYYAARDYAGLRFEFGRAYEREREEAVAVENIVHVPARRPFPARSSALQPGGPGAAPVDNDGAFAVDVALEPLDRAGLNLSFPPRPALNDTLVALESFTRIASSDRWFPRSRIAMSGNPVILAVPVAGPRTLPLT